MIRLTDLHMTLPGFTLDKVSLHVRAGEFFALMGSTGSGKTLVLETVAGLTKLDGGTVELDGRDVTKLPPENRAVSLVYQDHSLFPHLTVLQNVMFGQRYHGIDTTKGRKEARALLSTLGLDRLENRKPTHLSGGEKQRTSLARALACRPDVILLDEPLSSLDPQFRGELRLTLKDIHEQTGATFLMVTHDFADALTLAERAAVIQNGSLLQQDTVENIFRHPATPFVASFVGMTNVFPANYCNGACCFAGTSLTGLPGLPEWEHGFAALRPEDAVVGTATDFPDDWYILRGTVERLEREGFTWTAIVKCGDRTITAMVDRHLVLNRGLGNGSQVAVGFSGRHLHHMPEAV
ncbi:MULTISPECIES: ABC transporter ATP-binding protein [unclassified Pseudodesulfovibrio]|uniref:ABC transporter ATP-binding protein n=1 Tax=unclassified Pseudodesulfovibrio TaxID=2661612 RepID=UPI000FEB71F3|nr:MULTISPECIES: ABC transporter ATP-binding protein [unclassified Pseudodesulfovibrio]MCJ2165031.1 ABC transporter ATP-binding protein [Pseudodesulfovibrio sp. S3-i]RWU03527.1 ABC transporter ATP-binding protein [Pseudodesulfovibrio sp. S3]